MDGSSTNVVTGSLGTISPPKDLETSILVLPPLIEDVHDKRTQPNDTSTLHHRGVT